MDKINNITKALNDFEKKYEISRDLVVKYVTAVEMNDASGMEMYSLIFSNLCPNEEYDEMKSDLKEIMDFHLK